MNPTRRIANAPDRPVMLFDGDCRFCRLWIERWRQSTVERVEYLPLQEAQVAQRFPEISRDELEQAVHFIDVDGSVFRAAEAVFRSLAVNPAKKWPLKLYKRYPAGARVVESAYAFIAKRRQLFSWLTRTLWGNHVERSPDILTRWMFLRGLGVIYLIAFVSLWVQVKGLIGSQGILPAGDLMAQAHRAVEANQIGLDRFRLLPTLCWFSSSDASLQIQCALGTALAVLLVGGVAQRICLAGLWLIYLSLATVGQDFFSFQWDNLLLEAGLLGFFFAPWQIRPGLAREKPAPRAPLWLLRLLLFKLMFLSGVVKLMSGDPLWRNFTALSRHYETQPLPNAVAWYFHQMPIWFHKTSCVMMFAIELAVPFLLFAPRRPRLFAAIAIAGLQLFILFTGNFTFFNWLTIVLCFVAVDDFTWRALFRSKAAVTFSPQQLSVWTRLTPLVLVVVIGGISISQIFAPFGFSPAARIERFVAPFRSVSSYGLFAVMTSDRPEIIVEGSNDGRDWKEYSFRHKPGTLNRRPTFVAPHQPRLDWQMWFAALGDVRSNPWFVNFCARLLEGSPETAALLENNPFPSAPPKFIRARLYDYKFTTREERQQTGNWWKREFKGEYIPAISLEMLRRN